MTKILDRMRLDGKAAIVTGGAGGIGAAYARGLAEAGASVIIADLNGEGAAKAATELSSDGYPTESATLDVTKLESAEAVVAQAVEKFGGLDILVNNAGLMTAIPKGSILEIPLEASEMAMRVNAWGMVVCARAAVPAMQARGGGRIINQSSNAAFEGGSLYRITKHTVVSITVALAKELGPQNILVNAIAPGLIKTEEGFRSAGGPGTPQRAAREVGIPAPNPDRDPEDLVGALILLASDAGSYINGQTFLVDGGKNCRL